MIKDLFDVNVNDIDKIFSNTPIVVSEKMDLIYFRIDVTEAGIIPLKYPKFEHVNAVDVITNSIYKDITSFVDDKVSPKHDEIMSKIGNCQIGFFYAPVHKTKHIIYDNIPEGSFILSDVLKPKDVDKDIVVDIFSDICWNVFCTITECSNSIDINKLKACLIENDKVGAVECFVHDTISMNPINDIEGIIIDTLKYTFKIIINDSTPVIDKDSTLIYRDIILNDFAHIVATCPDDVTNVLNTEKTYLDRMYNLFLLYFSKTEILNKYYISGDDLLPPHEGYFGDMSLDELPPYINLVIYKNDVAKNILRLFLHTFNTSVYNNKFQRFNESERATLTEILVRVHQ